MPVSGRINRKENLRSKTALKKSKVNADKEIHTTKHKTDSNKLDTLSRKQTNALEKKDFNIVNKASGDNDVEMNAIVQTTTKDIINSGPKEKNSVLISSSRKVKTFTKEAQILLINEMHPESPKKKGRPATKKLVTVTEETVNAENEVAKRKVRSTFKEAVPEIVVQKVIVKSVTDEVKNKNSPVKERKTNKNKITKQIETTDATETVEKNEVKLGRRNAFQKDNEQKMESVKVFVDKMEIKGRKTASRVAKKDRKYVDDNEEDNIMEVDVAEDDNEVINPIMQNNFVQESVHTLAKDEENDDKKKCVTVKRTGSRLTKSKKPFVIENENNIEQTGETKDPQIKEMKIPGLVMLDNIKNRKSALIADEKKVKIVQENPTEKSKMIVKKVELAESALESTEPTSSKCTEKIPGLRMISDIKKRKSELHDNNKTIQQIKDKLKEAPIVSKKPDVLEITTETVAEKIPGLRMTAEIKKRKSDLLALSKDDKTFKTKTKIRQSTLETDEPAKEANTQADVVSSIAPRITRERGSIYSDDQMKKQVEIVDNKSLETETVSKNKTVPISESEKIPGLSTIQYLKQNKGESKTIPPSSYKRPSIHATAKAEEAIKCKTPIKKSRLSTVTSDKIPGLSATNQLKQQKSQNTLQQSPASTLAHPMTTVETPSKMQSTLVGNKQHWTPTVPTLFSNITTPINTANHNTNNIFSTPTARFTHVSENIDLSSPIITGNKSLLNPSYTSTPTSGAFNLDKKPSASILTRPSPYKRPMSCLDQSDDEVDSRLKMSRVQLEKRQSVTFNQNVEVKEIHGNSFNSVSDDASFNDVATDLDKVRKDIEKTKHQIAEKRCSNSFSQYQNDFKREKQRGLVGASAFDKMAFKPLAKKNSDLSELLAARHRVIGQQNSFPSKSSALKKVASAVSSSSAQRNFPNSVKSFSAISQKPIQPTAMDESNDSLDNSQSKESKGTCVVM